MSEQTSLVPGASITVMRARQTGAGTTAVTLSIYGSLRAHELFYLPYLHNELFFNGAANPASRAQNCLEIQMSNRTMHGDAHRHAPKQRRSAR